MGYVESVKSTIEMMIFSFFFMLFYTVTHVILSVLMLAVREIVRTFCFIFGVGRWWLPSYAVVCHRKPLDAIGCGRKPSQAFGCHRLPSEPRIDHERLAFSFPKSRKLYKALFIYYLLSSIYGGLKSPVYRRCASLVRRFLAEVRRFLGISWEVFSIGNLKLGGF